MNTRGGVEANLTVTPISKSSEFLNRGFYCVVEGHPTIAHIKEGILEKKFNAKVVDVSRDFGILSIQGHGGRGQQQGGRNPAGPAAPGWCGNMRHGCSPRHCHRRLSLQPVRVRL